MSVTEVKRIERACGGTAENEALYRTELRKRLTQWA
jgi:hypothetical protein